MLNNWGVFEIQCLTSGKWFDEDDQPPADSPFVGIPWCVQTRSMQYSHSQTTSMRDIISQIAAWCMPMHLAAGSWRKMCTLLLIVKHAGKKQQPRARFTAAYPNHCSCFTPLAGNSIIPMLFSTNRQSSKQITSSISCLSTTLNIYQKSTIFRNT